MADVEYEEMEEEEENENQQEKNTNKNQQSNNNNQKNMNSQQKSNTNNNSKIKRMNYCPDDNNYNVGLPEQVTSTRSYLEETVTSVIKEALYELAKRKPENPLKFIGNYILNKAHQK